MTDQEKEWAEACERLHPKAREIAESVLARINSDVPLSDPVIRYSRQWTLEKVIGILEASV